MELEEFIEQHNPYSFGMESVANVQPFLNELRRAYGADLSILPCDDAVNGDYGFLLTFVETDEFDQPIEEHAYFLSRNIFQRAERIVHESYSSANLAFKKAAKDNQHIAIWGEPKQLLLGFIVTAGDSRVHHVLKIKDYKRRAISRKLDAETTKTWKKTEAEILGTIEIENDSK